MLAENNTPPFNSTSSNSAVSSITKALNQGLTIKPGDTVEIYNLEIPVINGVPQLDIDRIRSFLQGIQTIADGEDLDPVITAEVRAELLNPAQAGRTHYSYYTHQRGCNGPICKLKVNHRARQKRLKKAYEAGKLDEFITRMRWTGNTQRWQVSELKLNKMIARMLTNQGRRIPFYLQLLIRDPEMNDRALWEAFLKLEVEPTRDLEEFTHELEVQLEPEQEPEQEPPEQELPAVTSWLPFVTS